MDQYFSARSLSLIVHKPYVSSHQCNTWRCKHVQTVKISYSAFNNNVCTIHATLHHFIPSTAWSQYNFLHSRFHLLVLLHCLCSTQTNGRLSLIQHKTILCSQFFFFFFYCTAHIQCNSSISEKPNIALRGNENDLLMSLYTIVP